MTRTPASRSAPIGGPRSSDRGREPTFELGHTSSTVASSASSATSAGSSIARTPWEMRVTGSSSAARTDSAARCSPAWTVQPSPEPAAISYARANWARRLARLVADQVEADDVGMAVLGVAAGDLRRAASTPKLRIAAMMIRASIPWSRARVVDPCGDPRRSARRRTGRQRGVVGRGDQLDVDRALARRSSTGTRR